MEIYHHLPKIELHAHLNGSISLPSIQNLIRNRKDISENSCTLENIEKTWTMNKCFEIFAIIHSLTDNLEAIKKITEDVIHDFHADNVIYLELRTTPKCYEGIYTKEDYILSILGVIISSEKKLGIMVRLLLSLDRGRPLDDAESTLEIAKTFLRHPIYKKYISGIDVSGNPSKGSIFSFLPLLQEAKNLGLKLAIHLMEVDSSEAFQEAKIVVEKGLVDRVGHGTYFDHKNPAHCDTIKTLTNYLIPIEICLTSNLKCGTVASLEDHHIHRWYEVGHPIIICTDDKGVFNTTLTEEYELCSKALNLNPDEMARMVIRGVGATFLNPKEKQTLLERIQAILQLLEIN